MVPTNRSLFDTPLAGFAVVKIDSEFNKFPQYVGLGRPVVRTSSYGKTSLVLYCIAYAKAAKIWKSWFPNPPIKKIVIIRPMIGHIELFLYDFDITFCHIF